MMPATMLVMVVADAEPVRVAHIRGSPAACVCVCVAAETADALLTCLITGFYSELCSWVALYITPELSPS